MNISGIDHDNEMRIWIAFTGETEIGWLRWLRKDFRHCFAIMHDGERWLCMDPLSNHTEITVHQAPAEFDLPAWLRQRGYIMVEAKADRSKKTIAPILPFTCVEAVKRLLGIHAWHIITPWQLYQYLLKKQKPQKQSSYHRKEFPYGKFISGAESAELCPV